MNEAVFEINGTLGVNLHVVKWHGDQNNHRGVIHILHGMAEHCYRYKDFASFLVSQGWIVYAHDHRKHGVSTTSIEEVGLFDSKDTLENILLDVKCVHDFIHTQEDVKGIVLVGHSMGSLIARCYLKLYGDSITQAIFIGTAADKPILGRLGILMGYGISFFQKSKRNKLMNSLTIGGYNLRIPAPTTPYDWLSTDEAQILAFIKDVLCGYIYSTEFYTQLARMVLICNSKKTIKQTNLIPILMISGKEDPVGAYGVGVNKVYKALAKYNCDVSMILFEDMRHEVLNEKNKQKVYDCIGEWLK